MQLLQNLADDPGLGDEADDPHLTAAFRAFQRIDFLHLFDALPPGGDGNFLLVRFRKESLLNSRP